MIPSTSSSTSRAHASGVLAVHGITRTPMACIARTISTRRLSLSSAESGAWSNSYIKESIQEPKAKVVDGFQPVMPVPAPPIDEVGIDSIVMFIKEQKE